MAPQPSPARSRRIARRVAKAALGLALLGSAAGATAQPGPVIDHAELKCVLSGEHLKLRASVSPLEGLTTVKAYFRANLYTQFYYVEMTRAGDFYEGILPKPSAEIDGLHYYLEAMDTAFNSARTAEYTPQVVASETQCEEENPVAPLYVDPASITVGSTGAGAPLPPGFLSEGIAGTIPTIARQAGGGGSGLLIGVAAAGAGAAGVGVLVASGGDDELPPDVEPPSPTGGTPPPPTMPTIPTMPPPGPSPTGATACFETSPNPPTVPIGGSVRFDASCTMPAREQIASYTWDLSDGRTDRISRVVNRRYGAAGTFPATLTVTALDGSTDTTTMNVIVQDTAPPPSGGGGGGGGPGPPSTADVAVSVSGAGGSHTYTIRNNGPLDANGVTFNASLNGAFIPPGSFSFTGFPGGCTFSTNAPATANCSAATMPVGAVYTVTITVTPVSPTTISSSGTANAASPPDSVANNSASLSNPAQKAPEGSPERRTIRMTSSLELPPGDGSSRTQLTFNESQVATTDNSGPSTHDVPARGGENLVQGRLLAVPPAEGRWRFDFTGAEGFVPGSFRIDEGNVIARSSHHVVFRVAPGMRRVRFRFEARSGSPSR